MKTKIIYISGSEVFNIADIRAAFDEVRAALALDKETVLFGVPVDADNALGDVATADKSGDITEDMSEYTIDDADITITSPEVDTLQQPEATETVVVPEPVAEEEPVEKPKKATRRTRAKVVPIKPETDTTPEPEPENIPDEKPAIPILSVLGAKSEQASVVEPEPMPEPESNPEPMPEPTPIIVTPIDETPAEPDNEPIDDKSDNNTQHVSISDMLVDDSEPVDTHEKTLEELLESMTPLGEDEKIESEPISEFVPEPESEPISVPNDDTDATLELLATEFAASEDKIVAPAKTETRGKIGKLKNILPFKKAKRDDNGLMGALFGWAGVANDEDFTIPGFFANAKK